MDNLKRLDELFRCGICGEYFDTCVITECCHSFCSFCIRKHMTYNCKCPDCFHDIRDANLRTNRIVDKLVAMYNLVKKQLKRSDSPEPQVQESDGYKSVCTPVKSNKSTLTPIKDSKLAGPSPSKCKQQKIITNLFQNMNDRSASPIKTVQCPVCNVSVPERNINSHLDECINFPEEVVVEAVEVPKPTVKRKYITKMIYSLMSSNQLRTKLREYGLNCHGDTTALQNRLKNFVTLYNSECDKENPRSLQEIVTRIERDEKNYNTYHQTSSLVVRKASPDLVAIEQNNKKYISEHKDAFKKLIDDIKKNDGTATKTDKKYLSDISTHSETGGCSKEDNVASSSLIGERHVTSGPPVYDNASLELDYLNDSDESDGSDESISLLTGAVPMLDIPVEHEEHEERPDDTLSDTSDEFFTITPPSKRLKSQKSLSLKLKKERKD